MFTKLDGRGGPGKLKPEPCKTEIVISAYLQANDDKRAAEFAIFTNPSMISRKNAKLQIGRFG